MKLEVGKYYRTRDGRKIGPMYRWKASNDGHPYEVVGDQNDFDMASGLWAFDGSCDEGSQADLISEWADESEYDNIAMDCRSAHDRVINTPYSEAPEETLAEQAARLGICITLTVGGTVAVYDGRKV